ncbi:hypothetical protein EV130_101481 [Rhizobium azibense]|nr:hypothetical protein EV130_101481 [Rhizobium azibense]TCU41075.1 hypothetical protein EV129_101362 [Rhizobium azibense]
MTWWTSTSPSPRKRMRNDIIDEIEPPVPKPILPISLGAFYRRAFRPCIDMKSVRMANRAEK